MVSFDDFVLRDDCPIYSQIIRYVKQGIAAGIIRNQEEIPSRRALSALLGVNPNTIQKAYHILEEEGVIVSRSGAKSFVCANGETVSRIRMELLTGDTELWVNAMKRLGMTREDALKLAEDVWG
ncbi:MAG: GntR family transcriptional regulator [Lachnospiraceae bacterium]|nr:GntR family transcriptional regulator [Lachnospiraceae bacterium]